MRKGHFLLLSLLIIALGLRLYRLDWPILIDDELSSVLWWIDLSFLGKLIRSAVIEPSPPLYFILLHGWIKFFGAAEFSVRFFSVLMGLGSIIMLYLIGKELINIRTGLAAASIMAISPYHLYHSTYARMYALLLFLILLSFYFFIKLLKEPQRRWLWGYILSTVLSLYTHYSSLYLILVQNIYFLIFWKDHRKLVRRWIQAQSGVALLFLPWLPVFLKNLFFSEWSLKTNTPIPFFDTAINIKNIISRNFMPYIGRTYFVFHLEDFYQWRLLKWIIHHPFIIPLINILIPVTFTIFFISGLIYLFKDKKRFTLITLYFLLIFIFTVFFSHYNRNRFFFQVCPAFYLILASGIMSYKGKIKSLSIGLLLVLHLIALTAHYAQIRLSPVKSAFAYLKTTYQNGDVILINSYDIRNRGTNFWYQNRFQNDNAYAIRLLVLSPKASLPNPGNDATIPPSQGGPMKKRLKPLLEKLKKSCRYQNVEDIYETISTDELDKKKRIWYVGDENRSLLGSNKEVIAFLKDRLFTITNSQDFDSTPLYFLEK